MGDGGTWTLALGPWHELERVPGVWATYWPREFHSDHPKEVSLIPKRQEIGGFGRNKVFRCLPAQAPVSTENFLKQNTLLLGRRRRGVPQVQFLEFAGQGEPS